MTQQVNPLCSTLIAPDPLDDAELIQNPDTEVVNGWQRTPPGSWVQRLDSQHTAEIRPVPGHGFSVLVWCGDEIIAFRAASSLEKAQKFSPVMD